MKFLRCFCPPFLKGGQYGAEKAPNKGGPDLISGKEVI
jgi:hypothetical protein